MFATLLILAILLFLVLLYLMGPAVPRAVLPTEIPEINQPIAKLAHRIQVLEAQKKLRPDNEARIVWADASSPRKTSYSLVYIHGFSASHAEGDPIHRAFAERYGCNLYLARLQAHGMDKEERLKELDPEKLVKSALYALAVGQKIGERVILMGSSTGCTLMLWMAAHHSDKIAGLICYSPNIALANRGASLLSRPWGRQILYQILKGKVVRRNKGNPNPYWDHTYHADALLILQALLDAAMRPDTFRKIQSPVFMGYYYKNKQFQDKTVSVSAMLQMFKQLGTPASQKRKIAFANVGEHPLASKFYSKDLAKVQAETFRFTEEILGLPVLEKQSQIS